MSYKVISLFSGIGGLDLGMSGHLEVHRDSVDPSDVLKPSSIEGFVVLRKLPFNTVFANDIESNAKKLYVLNNPDFNPDHYVVRSVHDLLEEGFEFPKGDVVTGGFPCQDFSLAGKRRGFQSTKSHTGKNETSERNRGTLYMSMIAVVEQVRPKIFVAENVQGLLLMPEALEIIKQDFEAIRYHVVIVPVNCPDFGIPQTRKRVLIIGFDKLRLTKVVRDKDIVLPGRRNQEVACRLYLEHLLEPEDTEDPSQRLYSKAKYRSTKCQGQTEIDYDGLAPTIRAEHHGNIEFRRLSLEHGGKREDELEAGMEERRLTVRECGMIQTFPPKFQLNSKEHKINGMQSYKYIGNAVPPLLGFVVGKFVESLLTTYFD